MSEHAKLAPSKAERWMACPGSIAACEGIPDEETDYAAEGTFAHEVAARCLLTGVDATELVGHTDFRFTVDEEMAEHIQSYLDVVRQLQDDWGCERPLIEQKVALVGLRDDIFGTADCVLLSGDGTRLDVVDLKFGRGVAVPVDDNPQLMTYGLATMLTHDKLCSEVREINLHIVQPRHFQGGHKTAVPLSDQDLWAWGKRELEPAARATEIPGAALVAGDHCRFCPAKPTCPELRKSSIVHAQHLFKDVALTTPTEPAPLVSDLTPAQVGQFLDAFPMVEQWIAAVRADAENRVRRGEKVPGWKLVNTTGHRKWIDEKRATEFFRMSVGDRCLTDPKLRSPAQVEKLLPKAQRDVVSTFAVKPSTGAKLARSSDSRPAVTLGDVFDEINNRSTKEGVSE